MRRFSLLLAPLFALLLVIGPTSTAQDWWLKDSGSSASIPQVNVGKNFTLDPNALGCWLIFSDTTEVGAETDRCDADGANTMSYFDVDGPPMHWSSPPIGSPVGRNAVAHDGEQFQMAHDASFNSQNLTVGCWAAMGAFTTPRGIISKNDTLQWEITYDVGPSLIFEVGNVPSNPITVPVASRWYHLAMRYDGTGTSAEAVDDKIEIFINGAIDCSGAGGPSDCVTGVDPNPADTSAMNLGSWFLGFQPLFGDLYECMYFDRVLSDAEMAEWFLCGADGFADGRSREAAYPGATCDAITSCC